MILFILLYNFAFAKDLPGEELFVAPGVQIKEPLKAELATSTKPKLVHSKKPNTQSNIPNEYFAQSNRQSTLSELVQPPKGTTEIFRAIRIGDSIDISVGHSVIAFSDEKAPVVATIQNGNLKGLRFIGESYLEPNTKRIFINFNKLIQGQNIFEIKGVGVSENGQPGLTGEYHSREAEYFAGDFAASFAAGYFDGLVPTKTNVFGQIQTDSSVDTAVKKGLASGSLSTANRFREKLKKVPEFSELKGPFELKILILDQAKTSN